MTASPALWAYLLASRLAVPLAGPILRRRLSQGKEHPERLAERLGTPSAPRPDGKLVWLHGASVGEAMSMQPLIAALNERADVRFLVTTGTVTSARRMAEVLPEGAIHQFVPVDTASAVGRFLDHWHPELAIWMESELWPRLVVETARRGTPMAMVNARLSEQSARGWKRAPAMARALLGSFAIILTQDEETVERLATLGIKGEFARNLKTMVPEPECDTGALGALREAIGARPVWLAASTHPGEEAIAAEAHRILLERDPATLMILAPRHPERGRDVLWMLSETDLRTAHRSMGEAPAAETEVLLADTLGEMGLWYRLAPVTFVGGSLAPHGGHTPFEPILLGSAVVHGPYVANFAQAYAALDRADGARCVNDAAGLAEAVAMLMAEPGPQAERARAVHAGLLPDIARIANRLLALMEGAG